jgi:hypothetical protein
MPGLSWSKSVSYLLAFAACLSIFVATPIMALADTPPTPVVTPGPNPNPTPSPSPSPGVAAAPPTPAPPSAQDNLQAVTQWVSGGGTWMLCQVAPLLGINPSGGKCPSPAQIPSPPNPDWFAPLYARMVGLAGLLLLPMLLLALFQSLIRQDWALALKAAFGYVPLAVILTASAVGVVQSLLNLSDSFTAYILQGYEVQLGLTITGLLASLAAGTLASATGVGLGTGAATAIAAMVALMAVVAIIFELLIRQALIYAAVLFMPLSFAAMVWPRLASWSLKLIEVVLAAVFSKFLIISILVLGSAAFTSPQGGGAFDSHGPPGTALLVGMVLVSLAALSPVALFWMLPSLETAVLAQFHGVGRQPVQAAARVVQNSIQHLALRQMLEKRRAVARSSANRAQKGPSSGAQVVARPAGYRSKGKKAKAGEQAPSRQRKASGQ